MKFLFWSKAIALTALGSISFTPAAAQNFRDYEEVIRTNCEGVLKATRGSGRYPEKRITLAITLTSFGGVIVKSFARQSQARDDFTGAITTYLFDLRDVFPETFEPDAEIGKIGMPSWTDPNERPKLIERQFRSSDPKRIEYFEFYCRSPKAVVEAFLGAKELFREAQ